MPGMLDSILKIRQKSSDPDYWKERLYGRLPASAAYERAERKKEQDEGPGTSERFQREDAEGHHRMDDPETRSAMRIRELTDKVDDSWLGKKLNKYSNRGR